MKIYLRIFISSIYMFSFLEYEIFSYKQEDLDKIRSGYSFLPFV